ncbi:MAG: hypothetical protein A3H98_03825 [Bacteroidetes bacterium RIFCSPLOWO2_02_FULL_36_8]|nr:MAG: hypothetical protein A3H98_03825 [Bacteroidetes bacterium RIFCSPLOWO2_02_FULL_36_8]
MHHPFNPEKFFKNLPSTHSGDFEKNALALFEFQFEHNKVYREYSQRIGRPPEQVDSLMKIPFLPVRFFKTHPVFCGDVPFTNYFLSYGTTGTQPSKHYIKEISSYLTNCVRCYNYSWGALDNYSILALIPLLKNRETSSLVHMVEHFIQLSNDSVSGFYYENEECLADLLSHPTGKFPANKRIILLGLSYALYDFFYKHPIHFPELILMETGGMKGRKKEMTRMELHEFLTNQTGVQKVYSEYGMTELMSQSYIVPPSFSFSPPPWMKILIRDIHDPFHFLLEGKRGAVNVIDLANIHTCAFLELDDLGIIDPEGNFQILGRMDESDWRGCNLMIFS